MVVTIQQKFSGSTTPGQSGPLTDSNDDVLRILQSSRITGVSQSDCVVY